MRNFLSILSKFPEFCIAILHKKLDEILSVKLILLGISSKEHSILFQLLQSFLVLFASLLAVPDSLTKQFQKMRKKTMYSSSYRLP